MKDTRNLFFEWVVLASFGVLIIALLGSCGFCGKGSGTLCDLISYIPVKELTDSGQTPVPGFEGAGTINAYHGFGCAESNNSEEQDFIMVEGSLDIPPYATNATVFLNGSYLKYLNGDHHVEGLGTVIHTIRIEGRALKWRATGVLSDKNFDDPYSWCYYYTVVAWNSLNINLTVDHKDGGCYPSEQSEANYFSVDNDGTTTALSSFPSFLQNPEFASSKTVAILPRGFGFEDIGTGTDFPEFGCDIKLLQIGYNLDHSEIFIENGKRYKKKFDDFTPSLPDTASQVDTGYVSWETYAIFKDDKGRRDYHFGETVSGLGRNDVGVIQPPFSILPREDIDNCIAQDDLHGVNTEEFVIENVPFQYAIPMLTGWQLDYPCGDENVKEFGIWIDKWSYDKDPVAPTGRLSYTLSSVLRDKNDDPGHFRSHKVTILGLRPTTVVTPSRQSPDLAPFSPFGSTEASFCRLEQGRKLRVTVRNQGNADAVASKTSVTFGNTPVTVDTPPIPKGGSVDVLFDVPASCFNADCFFKITVDSDNQIDELSEGNNSVNGGCIG